MIYEKWDSLKYKYNRKKILVSRILYRHRIQEHKSNKRVYLESAQGR